MSQINNLIAERLGGSGFGKETEIYKFVRIKQAKAEALALHPKIPLIDLGVGEPDLPADPEIVAVLTQEAGKPENRRYADNGILEFQEAAAHYLWQVYGVANINPATQIIHGIGSKPILAMLPLGLINPGDVLLATTPGYPVAATSFYCYVASPKATRSGVRFDSAATAAEYLLKNALISTVPWDEAGAYLRLAVTFEADGAAGERKVIAELKTRLERLELIFS